MNLDSTEAEEEHKEEQLEVAEAKSNAFNEQAKGDAQQLEIVKHSKQSLQKMVGQKEDREAVVASLQLATRATMVATQKADDAKAVEKPDLSMGIEAKETEIEREEVSSLDSLPDLLHREKQITVEIEDTKATVKRYKEELAAAQQRHQELVSQGREYQQNVGLSLSEVDIMVDQATQDADAAEAALAGANHKLAEQMKSLDANKEKVKQYSDTQVALHKEADELIEQYQAQVSSQMLQSFKMRPAEEAATGAALTAFNMTEHAAEDGRNAHLNSAAAEAEGEKQVAQIVALKQALQARHSQADLNQETASKQAELAANRLRQAELDLEAAKAHPVEKSADTSKEAQTGALKLNLQEVTLAEEKYEAEKSRAERAEQTKIQSKAAQVQLSQTLQQVEVAQMALAPLVDAAEENKQEAEAMTKDIEASLTKSSSQFLDTTVVNLQQCKSDQDLLYDQLVHLDVKAATNQVQQAASKAAREATNISAAEGHQYPAPLTLARIKELEQQDLKLENEIKALEARAEARRKECIEMDDKRRHAEEEAAGVVWASALDALNHSLTAQIADLQAVHTAAVSHNSSKSMKLALIQMQAIHAATIKTTKQSAKLAAQLDQREAREQAELQLAIREEHAATHSAVDAYESRRAQLVAAANVDRAHGELAAVVAQDAELRGRLLALGDGKKYNDAAFSRLFPLMHPANKGKHDNFHVQDDTQQLNAAKVAIEYKAQQSEAEWYAVIKAQRTQAGVIAQFQQSMASYALISLQAVRLEARETQLAAEYQLLDSEVQYKVGLQQECEKNERITAIGQLTAAQIFASVQLQPFQVLTATTTDQKQQLKEECSKAQRATSEAAQRKLMLSQMVEKAKEDRTALSTRVILAEAANSKALAALTQAAESTPAQAAQARHLLAQIQQVCARYLTAYLSAQEHEVSTAVHETQGAATGVQWQDQKAAATVIETQHVASELHAGARRAVDEASTITTAQIHRVSARAKEMEVLVNTRSNAELAQVRKKAYNATRTKAHTGTIKKQTETTSAQLPMSTTLASERLEKYQAAKEALAAHSRKEAAAWSEANVSPAFLAHPSALSASTMGTTWDMGPPGKYSVGYRAVRDEQWRAGGTTTCSGAGRVQYCTQSELELESAPSVLGESQNASLMHEVPLSTGPVITTPGLWPGCAYEVKVDISPFNVNASKETTALSPSQGPALLLDHNSSNSTAELQFPSIAQRMPPLNWTCSFDPSLKAQISLGGAVCSAFVTVEATLQGAAAASWVGAFVANPMTGSVSGAFGPTAAASSPCQHQLHAEAAQLFAKALGDYEQADCIALKTLAGLKQIEDITTSIAESVGSPKQLQQQAKLLAVSAQSLEHQLPNSLKAAVESSQQAAAAIAEATGFDTKPNTPAWVCPEHSKHLAQVEIVGGCAGFTILQVEWKGSGARLPEECIAGAASEAAHKFGAGILGSQPHCNKLTVLGTPATSIGLLAKLAKAVTEVNGVAVDLAVCTAATNAVSSLAVPLSSNSLQLVQLAKRAVSQFVGQARELSQRQKGIRNSKHGTVRRARAHGFGGKAWTQVIDWVCSSDRAMSGRIQLRTQNDCTGLIQLESVGNSVLFNSVDQKCRAEFQATSARVLAAALRRIRTKGCPAVVAASNAAAAAMIRTSAVPESRSNNTMKAHGLVAKIRMVVQRTALYSMQLPAQVTKPIELALHTQAAAERNWQADPLAGKLWSCNQHNSSQLSAITTTHNKFGVWVSARDRVMLDEKCRLQLVGDLAKQFSESLDKLAARIEHEGLRTRSNSPGALPAAQATAAAAAADAAQAAQDLLRAKQQLQQQESVVQQSKTLVKAARTLQGAYDGKFRALKEQADAHQELKDHVDRVAISQSNWLSQVADERRAKAHKAAQKKKRLQEQHDATAEESAAGEAHTELAQQELQRTLQLAAESDTQLVEAAKQQGVFRAQADSAILRWKYQRELQHNATTEAAYLAARSQVLQSRMTQVEQEHLWRAKQNLTEQLAESWAAAAPSREDLQTELSRVATEAQYEQGDISKLQEEQEQTAREVKSLIEQQVRAEQAEADRVRQQWEEEHAQLLHEQDSRQLAMENASVALDTADANTSDAALKALMAEVRLERAKNNLVEHSTLRKALQKDQQAIKAKQIEANQALDAQFKKLMHKHGSIPGTEATPAGGASLKQLPTNISGAIQFEIKTSLQYQKQQVEFRLVGSDGNAQMAEDSAVITELLPGARYTVKVRLETDGNWGDWSATALFESSPLLWRCSSDSQIQASISVAALAANVFGLMTVQSDNTLNRAIVIPSADQTDTTVASVFVPTTSVVDTNGKVSATCSRELQQYSMAMQASLLRRHAKSLKLAAVSSTLSQSIQATLKSAEKVGQWLRQVEQQRLRTSGWTTKHLEQLSSMYSASSNSSLGAAVASISQAQDFVSRSGAAEEPPGVHRNVTTWVCKSDLAQQAEICATLVTSELSSDLMAIHVGSQATLPLSVSCKVELLAETTNQFAGALELYTKLAADASRALFHDKSAGVHSAATVLDAFGIAVETLQLSMQSNQDANWLSSQEQAIEATGSHGLKADGMKVVFEKARLAEALVADTRLLEGHNQAILSRSQQQLRRAADVSRQATKAASECIHAKRWHCGIEPAVEGTFSTCRSAISCQPRIYFRATSKPTTNVHCLNEFQAMSASHMADSLDSLAHSIATCEQLETRVVALSLPGSKQTKQQQLWAALVAGRAAAAKLHAIQAVSNISKPVAGLRRASKHLQIAAENLENSSASAQPWVCTQDDSIRGAVEATSECVGGVKVVSWSNLASKQSKACQLEFAMHSMYVYADALRNFSDSVRHCEPLPAVADQHIDRFKNSTTAAVQGFASSAADFKELLARQTELGHNQLSQIRQSLHATEELVVRTKSSAAQLVGKVHGTSVALVRAQKKASEVTGLMHEISRKVNDMDAPHAVGTLHESIDEAKLDLKTRTEERHAAEARWERAQNLLDHLRDINWKGPPDEKFEQAANRQRDMTELLRAKLQLSRAQLEQASLTKNDAQQQSAHLAVVEQEVVHQITMELQANVPLDKRLTVAAAARLKVKAAALQGADAEVVAHSKLIEVAIRENAVRKQGLAERQVRRDIAKARKRQEIMQKQKIKQMKVDIEAAKKNAAKRAEREASMRKKVQRQLATMKKVSAIKIDVGYNDEAMRLDHRQTRVITNTTIVNHENLNQRLSEAIKDVMSLQRESIAGINQFHNSSSVEMVR
jgi:hypothetical protein